MRPIVWPNRGPKTRFVSVSLITAFVVGVSCLPAVAADPQSDSKAHQDAVTFEMIQLVASHFASSEANAEKLIRKIRDGKKDAADPSIGSDVKASPDLIQLLLKNNVLSKADVVLLSGHIEPVGVSAAAQEVTAPPEKQTAQLVPKPAVAETPQVPLAAAASETRPKAAPAESGVPPLLQAPSLKKKGSEQAAATAEPKETVTEELIRLLADRFALSQDDAQRLIKRVQEEKTQVAQAAPSAAPASPTTTASAAAGPGEITSTEPKGRVRVIYLPESEKNRIREEIKQEVIATAKEENWAKPNSLPDWVKRLKIDGDLRMRQEFDFFDSSNSPQFINFQAVNSGPPLNTNPPTGQPLTFPVLNSAKDREAARIRARIGLLSNVSDDMTVGFRFSTGNSTNPVSTNQTLGTDFNKFTFVIDRAYLNYRLDPSLSFWGGRIPNPWLSTDLVWDDDLSFDGIAGQYALDWGQNTVQHTTVGIFSVENTDFNFPSTSLAKVKSRDKWLLGFQTGADWKLKEDLVFKGAIAYYDFVNLNGKLSSSCFAPNSSVACDTDDSRPAFIQKGNTLFGIRDLVVLAPTDPTFQYFGLASPFRILNLTGRLDRTLKEKIHLIFDADFAVNTAFGKGKVKGRVPVNNFGPCPASNPGCTPPYEGGNLAFMFQGLWGYPKISEKGEWNAIAGYKRLESDSVVDAFNDSDFHLGGTNAKGYYLGGNYGFAHNAWLGARWLSATEVSGAPYAIDVLMLDLNARF